MIEPWLSLIGLGENGRDGLSTAAKAALDAAEIVIGGPRHLDLIDAGARGRPWPVPFDVTQVLGLRGRRVAVLASGDPFWHGAGGSLAVHLELGEWRAFPAPSTFSLAAAHLGWRLEEVACIGLHAAPYARLLPHLAPDARALCLMRDAGAVHALANWLVAQGFGPSRLWRMEALGGPRERITTSTAAVLANMPPDGIAPVAVAIQAAGSPGMPLATGLPDELFAHDGQISKRPIRAVTLSALAPRAGEHLWDIGLGSGSISIEWLLAAPRSHATGIESDAIRAERARANAEALGVADRLTIATTRAPEGMNSLDRPDAVFIGGGASEALLTALWHLVPEGTRIVANAVTLESETLFARWSAEKGGQLLRIDLAEAHPLGRMRGWQSARPVVQWSVTR
ncbi:MAG: precorrin-6y C5,15-methyltransferase (decarboxylating) subunit CbiE [Paracoccaceae bacterium]|nr:precorrin-6y C5,15-methyltransferase (decarboxylating) subunit CbiE [Paracoccaceae bacterium]MDE3239777.1 precorrin-6y C5,15-methyltransferase (decarboxylating) subunit CbiE [Paracoccaceae bacterium]